MRTSCLLNKLIGTVLFLTTISHCRAQNFENADWEYRVECEEPEIYSDYYSTATMPQYFGGTQKLINQIEELTIYPSCALEYKVSGSVNVLVKVNSEGEVKKVSLQDAPNDCLGNAAVEGIKNAVKSFAKPGLFEGKEVSLDLKFKVVFRINGMPLGSCIHTEATNFSGLAEQEFLAGNYQRAVDLLSKSIELDTTCFDYFFDRGMCQYLLGELDKSLLDFRISLNLVNHKRAEAHMYIGSIYLDKNNFDEALSEFELSLKLDKTLYKALVGLGKTYIALGRFDASGNCFKKALKQHHTPTDAHYFLGILFLQKGDYKSGVKSFNEVLDAQPANGQAYYNRGMCHARMRIMDKACEDWRKAKELGVKDAELLVETQCSGNTQE